MRIFIQIFLTFSVFIISACGGGGGSQTLTSPPPVADVIFKNPTSLPDLKPVYEKLCGYNTNLQNIFVADLNKDGKKDLILTLWCNQPSGLLTDAPSINGVIALTQQSDGSFINETKKIFGVDLINLNGVVVNGVINDFNKDGYDDIVFSVSREDGRLPSAYPASNHNEYNAFITSNGNGGYNITRQGQFAWNYGISLIDDGKGGNNVISVPIGYNWIIEVWSYVSGWVLDNTYQWVRGKSPLFTKDKALVEQEYPSIGLRLFSKIDNSWILNDSYSFGSFIQVPWLSWQQSLGTNNLFTINGKDYVGLNLENKCNLKLNPNDSELTSIVTLQAQEVIGGYKGGTVVESNNTLKNIAKLFAFETKNNRINQVVNFKINNFIEESSVYHLVCKDLNRDGYDDIMIQDWRPNTYPMIYLNDMRGSFNLVNNQFLPGLNQYKRGQSYIYEDIDGDGIKDLLHFPIVGLDSVSYSTINLLLYKGSRDLLSKDTVQ